LGKIKIVSTQKFICRKFATVCRNFDEFGAKSNEVGDGTVGWDV